VEASGGQGVKKRYEGKEKITFDAGTRPLRIRGIDGGGRTSSGYWQVGKRGEITHGEVSLR